MHILGCLDRPTSGQYLLDGKDVSRLTKNELARIRNHQIGFVFQGFNLLSRTSALENVELPLLYNGTPVEGAERKRRAMESLQPGRPRRAVPPLPEPAVRRPAAARRHRARADQQPVDPARRRADGQPRHQDVDRGHGRVPALNRERGITVLLITHERDIAEYGTRIVAFRDGVIKTDEKITKRRLASEELAALPPAPVD